jgi:glycine/D-amino acid oxidase-like deaminating enzyme
LTTANRIYTDVIVIGGGVTGCAASWYLAGEGVDVVLVEAGELNAQASGSNAGSLHAQIPADTFLELGEAWAADFAPTLRLLRRSIELWVDADRTLDGALEVRIGGGLMLASNSQQMRLIERKAAHEAAAGTPIELLDATELRRRAPYLSPGLVGAGFCPVEGKASPLVAAPAFARAAQGAGARILRRHPVQDIAAGRDGYRLQTPQAEIVAKRLVVAAGAGTSALRGLPGLEGLTIESAPIQVSVTEPMAAFIGPLLYYARAPLTMKQTAAGTVVIGGGWPARYDARGRPIPDADSLGQNLALALEVIPALAKVTLMRTWAATVNGTPDWKPIIGELPGAPGAFLAYVPWMGFTGSLAAARIVASQVQGKNPEPALDADSFAPR